MTQSAKWGDSELNAYDLCHFLYLHGWVSISELADLMRMPRPTIKKWIQRYVPKMRARGLRVWERDVRRVCHNDKRNGYEQRAKEYLVSRDDWHDFFGPEWSDT